MYCSNCGIKAAGNFCSGCGTRLAAASLDALPVLSLDWEHEVHYDVLLQSAEVRDLIARHAAQATEAISGEQFLELCDLAFNPLVGVSLEQLARIAAPLFGKLGVQTGKTRREVISGPVGKVVVAVLCSLAKHGRKIKQVHQAENGCVIEAVLPSDIWSFQGEVVVSVEQGRQETKVEAATKIPGQLFDWGKSNRCLEQLFADLGHLPVPLPRFRAAPDAA